MNERPPSHAIISAAIAGVLSSAVAGVVSNPIERLKYILQCQNGNMRLTEEAKYKGIIDYFRRVPKQEGARAFFRGSVPTILRMVAGKMIIFPSHDFLKRTFFPYNPKTEYWKFVFGSLAAGAASGAVMLLFTYPIDVVRAKISVDIGRSPLEIQKIIHEQKLTEAEGKKQTVRQFSGMKDCWQQVVRTDGLRGLYRGCSLQLFRAVFDRGFTMGCYDIASAGIPGEPTVYAKLCIAQATTLLSKTILYPVDTVCKRLMMQLGNPNQWYQRPISCIEHTWKNEGLRGFYGGFSVQLFWSALSALQIVFYDEIRQRRRA